MDNIKLMDGIRLGEFTEAQERFLDSYFNHQEIDRTQIYRLVSDLAAVPQLHDVRISFQGGPISGAALEVVADLDDPTLSKDLVGVTSLKEDRREQRYRARAVQAFERLEDALKRPGLFEYFGAGEIRAGHPLENRDDAAHYVLVGTVPFARQEDTRYKVDLTVPVNLIVR